MNNIVINKNLMSLNHTARKRSKKDIQFIVCHYVGGLGDAKQNTDYYKSTYVGASADFWVGHTGDIWQGNDYWNYYSWHCGGGYQSSWTKNGGGKYYGICTNQNSVGVEMCVKKRSTRTMDATDTDWYFEDVTVDSTAKLVAYLMKELDVDIDHVIRHYEVNKKICPNPMVIDNNKWIAFKAKVANYANVKFEEIDSVSSAAPTAASSGSTMYRVRKSWADSKSQLFAGTLEGAKRVVDQNSGYAVFDESGKQVYPATKEETKPVDMTPTTISTTTYPSGIPSSKDDYINKVSKIAVDLYKETKILPSVVIAQCCLETGYGLGSDSTELVKRNNLLGMKSELINSTWKKFSVWSGESFVKRTPEVYNGKTVYINDSFRVYKDYENCIRDYEMFLLHVQNGSGYKYKRIQGMTDPAKVINAIRIGTGTNTNPQGYCTDPNYETKILKLIKENNLTKYDIQAGVSVAEETLTAPTTTIGYYRVAKSYSNGKYIGQISAFTSKENAIKAQKSAGSGYYVFDPNGKKIYPGQTTTKPTSSSNITSTSSIPEKAVTIGRQIAVDNSHGYNNGASGRGGNPDYACSSFVGDCYIRAGVNFGVAAKNIYTKDMKKLFTSHGFEDVTSKVNLRTGSGLKLGDILLKPGSHTEIYSGNGKVIGARGNAQSGKPANGKAGDQTGAEIAESAYYNLPWTVVLRYKDATSTKSVKYRVRVGKFSIYDNANGLKVTIKNKLDLDCFLETHGSETWVYCGSFEYKEKAIERQSLLKKYKFDAEIDEV